MQKQRLIILIVGVVLGLVAVFMVMSYVKDMERTSQKEAAKALEKMRANQVSVLVAIKDIPPNTTIQPSMFESAIVPREYVQPQAATSLDRVSGMITVAPISRGEQISLSKLSAVAQTAPKRKDLSTITPPGKRAVSVVAENIEEMSNLLRPGDTIDLIAVLSIPKEVGGKKVMQQTIAPAFQNVLVLTVGQETDPGQAPAKGKQEKVKQITVALDPTQANILAFLQDQGKVRISLRSAQDTTVVEDEEPVTWDNVMQYLPSLKPEEVSVETVDIYRGTTKEKMPISK